MFDRVLIANRGEIACRVIATCRRLGIGTVAVYSDADAGAAHVAMADMAVRLGPAPARDSYLRGEAVIEAALATGAQAVHPGYGFLSENADFAAAVTAAGLTFVGPPADAIRAMGLKDAAKARMEAAGVPVVPGYHGADQDTAFLAGEAARIGFPVLIKARAGGGGKGMRRVDRAEEFAAALEGARREASGAFGDDAVLIEKFVASPRHIEMQVFADTHGGVVHLFERDCSLQRRHQKVIEEAPAPGMTVAVRDAMGAAATEAARAIGYVGAGTVEFIVDGSAGLRTDRFWFMEMNTRLQVEHPVTEAVTGHDLVEWQLRVAAGEPLPVQQEALSLGGHAVEARLYAEDPARGFLPATGRIAHLGLPVAACFARGPVRVDSGVRDGDAITPHYDPMIAKVIAHGPDRATALRRLDAALAETRIAGPVTNVAFLRRLIAQPDFVAGVFDTGLIDRAPEALTAQAPADPELLALAALAALGLPGDTGNPWAGLAGFRAWGAARAVADLVVDGAALSIAVEVHGPGRFACEVEGRSLGVEIEAEGPDWRVTRDGVVRRAVVVREGAAITVFGAEGSIRAEIPDPLAARDAEAAGEGRIAAPMPGLVSRILAQAGAAVEAGAPLVILEAMKMEHTLRAPHAGRVTEIAVEEGAHVADGAVLIVMEAEDG